MSKVLSIIVLILWIAFLFCDNALHKEFERVISEEGSMFGEMYGPYSYFYSYLKYGSFLSTIALAFAVWTKKK